MSKDPTKSNPSHKKNSSSKSGRDLTVRVKSARGRKNSSTRWLQRQLNDPYVIAAQRAGLRSRAAFKLEDLDKKFKFLKQNMRIIELGAAPGGWTQVLVNRLGTEKNGTKSKIIAIDLQEMAPVHGAEILQLDFMSDNALKIIKKALGGEADAVLSDMAPKITGHANTDHIRIMGLAETAYDFAKEVLAPGGCFISKVFQGGTEKVLLNDMKLSFGKVRHSKPPSSRAESAEMFVVAQNYRRDTKK
jgi:23S rRNA (uridine2552-2'-O)-methyltransferase